MLIFDFTVLVVLSIAVLTGLRTIHKHQIFFSAFSIRDVFEFRADAMLYIFAIASTSLCLIEAGLKARLLISADWTGIGTRWELLSLTDNMLQGLLFVAWHLLIGYLLDNEEFCTLCRRRF